MSFLPKLLCALCLFILIGCEDPGSSSEAPVGELPASQTATDTPTTADAIGDLSHPINYAFRENWLGDLDAMVEKRVIRVLTVYGLPNYYVEQGEEKGVVREMSNRFETILNQQFKRKNVRLHVTITPVARDQLIPALLEGRGDIINASLSITPQRRALLNFSIPSRKPVSEILVTGPAAPPVASIDDLAGQTIFVRNSSSYRESLDDLNRRFRQEGKPPVHIEPVSELLEDDDLIEMVNSGLLPWVIVDNYKVQLWDDVFTELEVREDIVFRSGGLIAWAFRKDSPELERTVNSFLEKYREGTLFGNLLKKRYLTNFDWASNALAQDEYSRFEELAELFRKYSEVYEIDYLMAAAQGFQESRLDQNARSGAGAVGIMQLLPSTARDPNVGIPDIHRTEDNIHAGIKYFSFLRNRYFSDPQIDNLNQTLLTLAAYNSGPGRMIKLRSKAEQLGYDPNIWFDNVEVVAAREVGREPVQYVANIFKYYLAYQFSLEQMARRKTARQRAGIE